MTRPVVLQFGVSGQVAQEVLAQAEARGVVVQALDRGEADLTDPDTLAKAIASAPDTVVAVINAAAFTAVDAAESEAETAFAVNAVAPGVMARACAERRLPFIHLSTDYVFDGTGEGAYRETDPVAPLGVYGRTKLAGEEAVLEAWPDAVILRTAWVFSAYGKNFVRTMLRLALERDRLDIVSDQHGCPTPASAIADAVLTLVARWHSGVSGPGGVFHFAGDVPVSWKEFADAIFAIVAARGRPVPEVSAISSSEFLTQAKRPANSVLDCGKIQCEWGIAPVDWQTALERDIDMILAADPTGV